MVFGYKIGEPNTLTMDGWCAIGLTTQGQSLRSWISSTDYERIELTS